MITRVVLVAAIVESPKRPSASVAWARRWPLSRSRLSASLWECSHRSSMLSTQISAMWCVKCCSPARKRYERCLLRTVTTGLNFFSGAKFRIFSRRLQRDRSMSHPEPMCGAPKENLKRDAFGCGSRLFSVWSGRAHSVGDSYSPFSRFSGSCDAALPVPSRRAQYCGGIEAAHEPPHTERELQDRNVQELHWGWMPIRRPLPLRPHRSRTPLPDCPDTQGSRSHQGDAEGTLRLSIGLSHRTTTTMTAVDIVRRSSNTIFRGSSTAVTPV
eukprot:scaffold1700_cov259-Pinguiococcus_pyrenoidosus.AAC.5